MNIPLNVTELHINSLIVMGKGIAQSSVLLLVLSISSQSRSGLHCRYLDTSVGFKLEQQLRLRIKINALNRFITTQAQGDRR